MRDAVGGWGPYTVSEIRDLFASYGFNETATPEGPPGGDRKLTAEEYHAAIDWSSATTCTHYLRLVEEVLDAVDRPEYRDRHERVLRALKRADIQRSPTGHFALPAKAVEGVDLGQLTSESDIRLHMARLMRLDQEPEEMIGAAKDLVEATAKHVLIELGQAIPANADVPGLSKAALSALNLHPSAIAPTTKGAEIVARILGGLGQAASGLAELRNLGYGVGHGRGRRIPGLKMRHGEFAARAAFAYVQMVLDTLHDPDAPWRKADQ